MSLVVKIISEGKIDQALLPALLSRVAEDRAGIRWPVEFDDAQVIPIPKTGFGAVVENVQRIVKLHCEGTCFDCAFFVVVLDHKKTQAQQKEIQKLLKSNPPPVCYGVAVQEVEAWWLADRVCVLRWLGLAEGELANLRYGTKGYRPERDDDPKATLDELTRASELCDSCYGKTGNSELAAEFAGRWRTEAHVDALEQACPQGFRGFCSKVTRAFRQTASASGRGA